MELLPCRSPVGTVFGCYMLIADEQNHLAGTPDDTTERVDLPHELVDAVLGSNPRSMSVLDVGCGTGSRQD